MKLKYLALPFCVSCSVYANNQLLDLDSISVTANTIVDTVANISGESIRHNSNAKTLDDVLSSMAGLNVARRSGNIKGRGVFIRGFDETRYLVVLNGSPLNGAGSFGGDNIDWNTIPVDQIESIEVIKGTKSSEFGNSPGGVIKISTISDTKGMKNRANILFGVTPQWDSKRILNQSINAAFSHKNTIGKWADYGLSLSRLKDNGFLRNNSESRNSIAGNLTIHLPAKFDLTGSAIRTVTEYGFVVSNHPGSKTYDPLFPISDFDRTSSPGIIWKDSTAFTYGDRSHWLNVRSQYDVSLKKSFGNVILTARGYLNDQKRTEQYYSLTDSTKLILERFSKPEDFTRGWKLAADQRFGINHLTYGSEAQSLRSYTYDIKAKDPLFLKVIPDDYPHYVEIARKMGAYAQDRLTLLDTILEVQAGVRFDHFFGIGDSNATINQDEFKANRFSPNLGVTAHLWKGGELGLSGGILNRMPNSSEYHFYYNSKVKLSDRTALVPEKANQIELSVGQKFLDQRVSLDGRGYYYRINDYIRSTSNARPDNVVYNVDRANFMGFEFEGSYKMPKLFSFNANYSFQKTSKSGDILDSYLIQPASLPEMPAHTVNAAVNFKVPKGFVGQIKLHTVSAKEVVSGVYILPTPDPLKGVVAPTLVKIDGYTTIDFKGDVTLIQNDDLTLDLKFGIDNIFDVTYQEKLGFPMEGTSLYMGLDTKF